MNMNNPKKILLDRNLNSSYIIKSVGIYPTYACNQNCSYCPHMNHGVLPKDVTKYISKEHIDAIPLFIKKYQHKDVPITIGVSGGEPTLNWDKFVYITEMFKSVENVRKTNLTTNLFKDFTTDELLYIADNYSGIFVSIDGKKQTQSLRSENSYEKVIENLITLLSFSKSIRKQPHVSVSMTISIDNYKYLYENIDFFSKLGINFSATLDDTSQAMKNYSKEELQSYIVGVIGQTENTKKDFGWPVNLTSLLLNCDRNSAYNTANILPDGKVYRCNIKPLYPITDLNDPDFKINYSGLDSFSVVEHDEFCENCEIKESCQYCYAATSVNRELYCALWRLFSKYDKKVNNV